MNGECSGMRRGTLVLSAALIVGGSLVGHADPVNCVLDPNADLYCAADEAGAALDGTNECVTASRIRNPNSVDLLCLAIEHEAGHYPDSTTCVTDGAIAVVLWWYDGAGPLVCAGTGEWWVQPGPYGGLPSACVWTGAGSKDRPAACVGRDDVTDADNDGQEDDPTHCPVWTAGSKTCFLE